MASLIDEITEQPRALRDTIAVVRTQLAPVERYTGQLRDGTLRSVLLTGMGASYNAALSAVHYLLLQGVDARVVQTADLLYDARPLLKPSTLLVGISQSGNSVEIRKLSETRAEGGPMIGVTNTVDSALARLSDVCLTMQAGPEASVSNKTYTATLAALYLLACALAGQPLDGPIAALLAAADEIARSLGAWQRQVEALADDLPNDGLLVFLGRGPSEASALCGALILNESAKVFTTGMTSAMFRHGPVETLDERVTVFIFAGSGPTREINLQLARYLIELGGRVIVVGPEGTEVSGASFVRAQSDDPWALPILEIVPIQLLAVRLCQLRGIEPGSFRYLRKVAKHE